MSVRKVKFQLLKSFLLRGIVLFLLVSTGAVQSQAAELALADLDGKEHKLSDYRGQWLVVNYWATWCHPCVEEMPELIFFHDKHQGSGVQVIGVNYENTPLPKVRAFIEEHLISFPVWLASPDEPSPLGRIRAIPTTFIVSPEGEVVHTEHGKVSFSLLEQLLNELRQEQAKAL